MVKGIKKQKKGVEDRFRSIRIVIFMLVLLSFADIIVLEQIYHPISQSYDIPWSAFYVSDNFQLIWWHVVFIPLCIFSFILLGFAAKSWRLGLSGIIAFATGYEDILYYILQGSWLPMELAWLNWSPIMGATRLITQTSNVTGTGVIISAIIGLIAIALIFYSKEIKNWFKKTKGL